MTRRTQKDDERHTLETFLGVLAVPHTLVEEREGPDFLLSTSSGQVGVEVVKTVVRELARLASGAPRFEADLERALRGAGVFADVTAHPHANTAGLATLPKNEQRQALAKIVTLATELAEEARASPKRFAHAKLVQELGRAPMFTPIQPRERVPTLWGLTVQLRHDEQTRVEFGASASRWGGIRPRLLEIVASKEAKIDEYRARCCADAFWLVPSADGSFPSEIRDFDVHGIELESAFDAVAIVGPRTTSTAWAQWLKAPT